MILALWLLGLAGAFFLGKGTRPTGLGSNLSAPESSRSPAVPNPGLSPAGALRIADPRAAAGGFSRAVMELETSEQFRSVFEELLPSFGEARSHEALFVLADAWASKDPEGACAWINGLKFDDPRNPYLFSALTPWAEKDPEAVLAWLDSNHSEPGASRDYLLAGVVRGMAGSDSDRALRLLLDLANSPERAGATDFLVRAWLREGIDHALDEVAALPGSELRLKERAIRQVIDKLSSDELESAKTWAAGLSSAVDRGSAHAAIAANWGRRDPEAAAAWVDGLGDDLRPRAYGEIATRWARMDPLAAGRWLDGHADQSDYDLAARAVAWNTVGIDPETAFLQVARITHPPLRDESFEQIGRIWLSEQPQQAKLFLEGESPIPKPIRERLLDSFE